MAAADPLPPEVSHDQTEGDLLVEDYTFRTDLYGKGTPEGYKELKALIVKAGHDVNVELKSAGRENASQPPSARGYLRNPVVVLKCQHAPRTYPERDPKKEPYEVKTKMADEQRLYALPSPASLLLTFTVSQQRLYALPIVPPNFQRRNHCCFSARQQEE